MYNILKVEKSDFRLFKLITNMYLVHQEAFYLAVLYLQGDTCKEPEKHISLESINSIRALKETKF